SFNYFGQSYSQIYVNHNGDLTFDAPWPSYTPQRFPMYGSTDVIAPFWTDLDNRGNGNIYYIQYTSGSILQQVTQDINRCFPALNFQANWVFIATWHEVAYYPLTGTQTTFQAVLTTNGQYSFVLMNYGSIASTPRYAGYDTISSSHHFTIPGSFSSDATGPNSTFSLGSNVNVPGRWAFRVDHGSLVSHLQFHSYDPLTILDSLTLRFTYVTRRLELPITSHFTIIMKTKYKLFLKVNHNGDLTFDAPWYSYTPQRFPMYGSKDVIAPFWTDLDNRGNGDIYYIQYTSGSILQQVTQDINRYFPALNFQANWVFIATWHEVAYFPTTGTQTTFQAVLTTNGQYSFVLMNYGSIASTSRYVQVRISNKCLL
uniref:Alpha-tectorin-like n=1 Tax=Xiphophorus maculatus TaxID=8083 RepID=A0A3B5R401_XIPMA